MKTFTTMKAIVAAVLCYAAIITFSSFFVETVYAHSSGSAGGSSNNHDRKNSLGQRAFTFSHAFYDRIGNRFHLIVLENEMERSPRRDTNPGPKAYQTVPHLATMINILLGRESRDGRDHHTSPPNSKVQIYTVGKGDTPAPTITTNTLQDIGFNTVNKFYTANSYNDISLSGWASGTNTIYPIN
jgi:hypothetical protein